MITSFLLVTLLITSWRLIKLAQLNRQYQQLIHQSYPDLGQSIAALNIQLQAAYKLWNLDPVQAMRLLHEAYSLSSSLMQDIRQTVKTLNSPYPKSKIQDPKSYEDSLTSRR
ncbi:MAG: histidine kinase dimerization/phosphoacceptor domain-containing protein [Leptolyngbya sp. Prado105]|jgi:hypothetical protein|nr:histidine kinase dimerization/phosphoacceptor domain-containing protein [Leptolyngbya sp. Prado105]